MLKPMALLLASLFASQASAQVDDSLLWIAGDTWSGTNGNAVIAAFDTDGSSVYQYDFARFASGAVANDPPPAGVAILDTGHHVVVEQGSYALFPYTPWTAPAGADPTIESNHWFSTPWQPSNSYDQGINFVSAGVNENEQLVDVEVDADGAPWTVMENGLALHHTIKQYPQAYFHPSAGETVKGIEVSTTHVYGFVENDITKNVTVYRQRRTPTGSPYEEQMSIVVSGKPYQAITMVDNGEIVLAEVEYDNSLVRAGTIVRTGESGQQWSVPLDKPVIDLKVQGGFLWALDSLGNVYRLDLDTGASTPTATATGPSPYIVTGVPNPLGFARGFHEGSEVYDSLPDACPTDPLKFAAGPCGCNFEERPAYNSVTETYGHSCVHLSAQTADRHHVEAGSRLGAGTTLGSSAFVGSDTFVGDNVMIDDWARVGNGAIVASNSTLGERAQIHSNTLLSRGTTVGPCAEIYNGTVIGRNATIHERVLVLANASIGYSVEIPTGSHIGSNTVIGNLVDFDASEPAFIGVNGNINNPAVIARGVTLGDQSRVYSGAVIGPSSVLGDDAVVEAGARLRKDVTLGAGAYIEDGARIGRATQFGANSGAGTDANLGTAVTVAPGACVPNDERVGSRTTVSSPTCDGPFNTAHVPNWDTTYRPNTSCFPDLPCVGCDTGDTGFMAPPF